MSGACAINLITEPVVSVHRAGERQRSSLTLPGVLAALTSNAIEDFPALRPHQRHPWHAFTVQLAAMALHRAGRAEPPAGEDAWAALLRGLTPDWPDDAPWCLVSPADQAALLQPPVLGGDLSAFKSRAATPDALDMLVTAKNHDLKSAVMADARPEDWLFALISLQTMEGFMGAGNYGISRMNGGFASRPALGVVTDAKPGVRFRRDVRVLLHNRDRIVEDNDLKASSGIGLVWLVPWDGQAQIRFHDLDPFYIEVCRRVRLEHHEGGLIARLTGSRKARIAATELKGRTGDPWTPIELADGGGKAWTEPKALTITGDGFSYRKMTELMLGQRYRLPVAQEISDDDAATGLAVAACGLARGQGKTEGYHERIVPLSKKVIRMLGARDTDALAGWARERVVDAGTMRGKVLRPALFALLQDGPEEINFRAGETSARADHFLDRLDRTIDARFFDHLWQEAEVADGGEDARLAVRFRWHRWLVAQAHGLLVEAAGAVPHASMRRYRARVRAEALFYGALHKHFPHLQPKERQGDVA